MDTNQQAPGSNMPPSPAPPSGGNQDHMIMGILAYLGILIVIPFLTESRNNPFVKFHLKQGLVLFLAELVAYAVLRVPGVGWISPVIGIASLILVVTGIINVVNGETKELPLIGHLANKINI
jgi:fumarate reductase subunit D